MKLATSILALAVAAVFAAGCNKPATSTANNNSGASATPGSSTTGTTTPTTSSTASDSTSTSTPASAGSTQATGDTTSATQQTNMQGSGATSTGAVSETVTTGKIKAAIAADSGMKDADVSVTTSNGVVTLGGTVKSQDQVAIATGIAQKQEGVQRVESNITVR